MGSPSSLRELAIAPIYSEDYCSEMLLAENSPSTIGMNNEASGPGYRHDEGSSHKLFDL